MVSYTPQIKLLAPSNDYLPTKAHDNDAGYDLRAWITTSPSPAALQNVLRRAKEVYIDGAKADNNSMALLAITKCLILSPIAELEESLPPEVKNVHLINSGFALKLPSLKLPMQAYAEVVSRSGLASKHKLVVINRPGIIDEGYTGPVFVALQNLSNKYHVITDGTRIAQLLFQECYNLGALHPYMVTEFTDLGERGSEGHGSSGLK